MTKNVKIALISFGVVGLGIGAYFFINYLKLKKAYETTLDVNQANTLIDSKTSGVPDAIIPDEITSNADVQHGTEKQEESEQDLTNLHLSDVLTGYGDY